MLTGAPPALAIVVDSSMQVARVFAELCGAVALAIDCVRGRWEDVFASRRAEEVEAEGDEVS